MRAAAWLASVLFACSSQVSDDIATDGSTPLDATVLDAARATDAAFDASTTTDAAFDASTTTDAAFDASTTTDAAIASDAGGPVDTGAPMAIAAHGTACALFSSGTVKCWGLATNGDIGNGTPDAGQCPNPGAVNATCVPNPVAVSGLTGVTAVAAGYYRNCAVLSGGTVECWGDNRDDALGVGGGLDGGGPDLCPADPCNNSPCNTFTPCSTTPAMVPGLTGAVAVSVGLEQTCALLADGTVDCWGGGDFGELGSAVTQSTTPVAVPGLSGVIAITSGDEHNCALLSGGTVECWGVNSAGELGNGTTTGPEPCQGLQCSPTPVVVSGLTGVQAIAAGGGYTCALITGGTVACWGGNFFGNLGNGTDGQNSLTPMPVSGLTGVTAIAAGEENACALLAGGTVECWGDNSFGAVGNGSSAGPNICGPDGGFDYPCATTPLLVASLTGATAIAVGQEFACALLSSGSIVCWGENDFGELGIGPASGPQECVEGMCSPTPAPVAF